ncbi:MAG: hypothetical protein E6J55_03815 [Deltaproteobacteria bacterium]|nr:MAG: hypothetical protein E6J55_03815 [Deltaproteobacteria bacterium]
MAEEQEGEEAVAELVRSIEAGSDTINVPAELIDEPAEAAPPPPRSLYGRILTMSIAEKLKLALRGNKDARAILIRDSSKLIRRFVMQNPRLSDAEVIAIARNRSSDDELLRVIVERREWMRNYQVRLALVTNPKTPLAVALRQLPTLGERDLRMLAKSRNVPQTVVAQARRLVLAMGRQA